MKYLLSLLLLVSISCKAPNDDISDKDKAAPFLIGTAEYYRQLALDADVIAANANASAIAAAKALPLVDVSAKTAAELQALNLDGVITSVDMSKGTPIVTFYVTTKVSATMAASRLKGFGFTIKTNGSYNATTGVIQTPGATTVISNLTSVPHMSFSFAKLVVGTNGAPDKWVSYLTTTVPTPEGTIGPSYTAFKRSTPGWQKNSVDQNGTLKDNGDGTYTYTFARDITKSKDYISSEYLVSSTENMTAVSANRIAGMGDLKYDNTLPHRLAIAIGIGTVPGTGTSNTNGTNQPVMSGGCTSTTSCSGTAVTALNFTNGTTLVYDFIPSTGKIKTMQRDIVKVSTCNTCHKDATATTTSGITTRGLIFHGAGGRNDVTQCVTCHNDQTRAQVESSLASVAGVYTGANGMVLDGYAVADFPIMVHKFHMSSWLQKSGTGYYVGSTSYMFPTKAAAFISKADSKLCYNCHTTNKTANHEDNWKTRPSRIACGACHDGIDFTTGLMTKSANPSNTDTTHGGGKQLDDSKCAGCHSTSDITKKHGL